MADKLVAGIGVLILLGLGLNMWLLWGVSSGLGTLNTRLAAMEIRPAAAPAVVRFEAPREAVRGSGEPKSRKARKSRRAKPKGRSDLSEQEKLARLEDRFESAEQILAEFVADEALNDEEHAIVLEELRLMHEAVLAIREDVRAKVISQPEGRKEARHLREDSDARLVEVLSKRQVSALRERLATERSD